MYSHCVPNNTYFLNRFLFFALVFFFPFLCVNRIKIINSQHIPHQNIHHHTIVLIYSYVALTSTILILVRKKEGKVNEKDDFDDGNEAADETKLK